MRGLAIILEKIGFASFAQQQSVLQLLKLAGCYEEQTLREDLKNAGYINSLIDAIVSANHHLIFMDEVDEDEEKQLLNWLNIATERAIQQFPNWPVNIYHEIYSIARELSSTLPVTAHSKYDVAVILGETQEELDTQFKKTNSFLKEKKIKVQTIFVPNKPGDTKEILTSYLDTMNKQNKYAQEASIPNVYKAIYFIAKTNRILIVSSQQNLFHREKAIQEFFINHPTWLSAELICLENSTKSPRQLLEDMARSAKELMETKNTSSAYFSASDFIGYGTTMGRYAFNIFYHPITTGENVITSLQPWIPSYKR